MEKTTDRKYLKQKLEKRPGFGIALESMPHILRKLDSSRNDIKQLRQQIIKYDISSMKCL